MIAGPSKPSHGTGEQATSSVGALNNTQRRLVDCRSGSIDNLRKNEVLRRQETFKLKTSTTVVSPLSPMPTPPSLIVPIA